MIEKHFCWGNFFSEKNVSLFLFAKKYWERQFEKQVDKKIFEQKFEGSPKNICKKERKRDREKERKKKRETERKKERKYKNWWLDYSYIRKGRFSFWIFHINILLRKKLIPAIFRQMVHVFILVLVSRSNNNNHYCGGESKAGTERIGSLMEQ